MNSRARAARLLVQVLNDHRSLTAVLESSGAADRDAALIQEICFGVCRWYHRLEAQLAGLLDRPEKKQDALVHAVLLIGLYQLQYLRIPDHAAVAETVAALNVLERSWAKGLVNAILRRAQRESEPPAAKPLSEAAQWSHPDWLLRRLQSAWPADWQAVCTANNQAATMTLRVNRRRMERDAYLKQLHARGIEAHAAAYAPDGLRLERPLPVVDLPGFSAGLVSVQDEAAQLAAILLDAQPGERILDACAAPGGKTAHILESQPALACLLALDQSTERLTRCVATLQRLQLNADCVAGDAVRPADWWDGRPFDRILIDAPCSATGVIRRHPDIKLLRRADDIERLRAQQQDILEALWPLLRKGGILLYATCSVLPEENTLQVRRFLQRHPEARERMLAGPWGRPQEAGRQILPGEAGMDGFYFACVEKA